jgi:hypothetical protein
MHFKFSASSPMERVSSRSWEHIHKYHLYRGCQLSWRPWLPHRPGRVHCTSLTSRVRPKTNSISFFQKPNGNSATAISRDIFPSSEISPPDYFDDLESFYYVLAYICIAFTEPHACQPNLPHTVSVWATNPQSKKSTRAKRAITSGSGVEYGHVQPYFGTFVFETLLEDLHTILKYRHEKRTARELNSPTATVTKEMIRKESDEDYEDVLERLDWAIEVMEDFGDGQVDEIDTQMTTFKLDGEPSGSLADI